MKKNSTTFELGINKCWPTDVMVDEFTITDDLIQEGLQNITHGIEKLSLKYFDKYLNETLGHGIDYYSDHKLSAWVNRYSKNESMEYHTHSGSWLSAIFYLVTSDDGELVLYDPRHFAARGYDMSFRKLFEQKIYKPVEGQLIMFPSFLYHSVRPTSNFRLCVPVDLFLFKE
jgi:hypothetical protein